MYNHEHYQTISTTSFNTKFDKTTRIKLHSLSIPINYINISTTYSNQVFYYNPSSFIVIPLGCYSLISFNKYLYTDVADGGAGLFVKVIIDTSGKFYNVVSFNTLSDYLNNVNGTIEAVSLLSTLNTLIYNNTIFYDRIKLYCNVTESDSNEDDSSKVLPKNFLIIPITSEPGQVLHFSYLKPLEFTYNNALNIQLYFTNMNDVPLQFNYQLVGHSGNPYILFIFEEINKYGLMAL